MARTLTVEFIGDTKNLEKAFGKTQAGADKTGSKLEKVKGPAKAAGIALGVGLAGALKVGFDELGESQKVMAQTNAVLKSTGGVAGVTAKSVVKLSGALSAKSGVDDEAIQSGANMLLTFKDIRNEVGKGNDIFDQATSAALDMSVAMGTDVKSASMTLGKALNDPIKGMSKLTKQGVTFTDAQKKQAEAMVKAGDVAGAQKIILGELSSEFGGSAKAAGDTFPGQLAKLKNSFEEVAASLTQMLMPAFKLLAGLFGTVGEYLTAHPGLAKALGVAVGVLATVFLGVAAATKIATLATTLWAGVTKVAAAAQWLFNAAMTANPIALVVIAIAALAAGIFLAYKKSETFRGIVNALWDAIKDVAGAVWDFVTSLTDLPGKLWDAGKALTEGVINGIKALPGLLKDAATWLWDKLKAGLEAYGDAYRAVGGWVLDKIVDGFKIIGAALASVGGWLKNRIVETIKENVAFFGAVGGWVLDKIVDGFKIISGALASVGGWLKNRIVEGVHLAIDGFTGLGGWLINRIVDGFKATVAGIETVGGWLKNRIFESLDAAKDGFLSLGGKVVGWIVDGLKGGLKLIAGFAKSILKVIDAIPGVNTKGAQKAIDDIVGLKQGGAFGRTGGIVNSPITLMGEEAPRHPEFVIPTNPAYRKRAQGLAAQAASAVGLAEGGLFGKVVGNLPGIGDLPDWLGGTGKHALAGVTDWIKKTIDAIIPDKLPGTPTGPSGVSMYQGLAMANWVIGAMKHARKNGFTGQATSGYRTQAENDAQGRTYFSQHSGTKYPIGAVDFGGFFTGLATKMAAVAATADYKYPLLAPKGFRDDGHASGTGHRKGGIFGPFVGSYANGGIVPRDGMAYVHRGESISPAGQTVVELHFANGMEWLRNYVTATVSERDRATNGAYRAGVA